MSNKSHAACDVEQPSQVIDNRIGLSRAAVLATLPLSIAVIPWGILTGALAIQIGLTAVQAQLMSLLVFAGAAQLSAMTLLSAGAAPIALFGSTFVISSRHLLYSVTFREHVIDLPLAWRISIAMLLTDEMFAVSQSHTLQHGQFSPLFAVVSGATFYVIWNIATFLGILAGDAFENLDALGLDFAIAATFIAMTFGELRRMPVALAIVVAAGVSVLTQPFLPDSYIIVAALLGMTAAFLVTSQETQPASSDNQKLRDHL